MEAAQATVDSDSVDVLKTLKVFRAYETLKASWRIFKTRADSWSLNENAFSGHSFLPGCEQTSSNLLKKTFAT